jgi:hypothetical protein
MQPVFLIASAKIEQIFYSCKLFREKILKNLRKICL